LNSAIYDLQRNTRLPDINNLTKEELELFGIIYQKSTVGMRKGATDYSSIDIRGEETRLKKVVGPLVKKVHNIEVGYRAQPQGHLPNMSLDYEQHTVRLESNLIGRFYTEVLGLSNANRPLPDCIKNGTEKIKVGFVRGVLSGGGMHSGRTFSINKADSVYLDDLKMLLSSIGIDSNIREGRLSIYPRSLDLLHKKIKSFPRQDTENLYRANRSRARYK